MLTHEAEQDKHSDAACPVPAHLCPLPQTVRTARGPEYVASHAAVTDPAGRPRDPVPGVAIDSPSDYGRQDVRRRESA